MVNKASNQTLQATDPQALFLKSLSELAKAKSITLDSKGNLVSRSFFDSIKPFASTVSPRFLEHKVIEFLILGKQWMNRGDLELVDAIARKVGLIWDNEATVNEHKMLRRLVGLLADEVFFGHAHSVKEYENIHRAFVTSFSNVLPSYLSLIEKATEAFKKAYPEKDNQEMAEDNNSSNSHDGESAFNDAANDHLNELVIELPMTEPEVTEPEFTEIVSSAIEELVIPEVKNDEAVILTQAELVDDPIQTDIPEVQNEQSEIIIAPAVNNVAENNVNRNKLIKNIALGALGALAFALTAYYSYDYLIASPTLPILPSQPIPVPLPTPTPVPSSPPPVPEFLPLSVEPSPPPSWTQSLVDSFTKPVAAHIPPMVPAESIPNPNLLPPTNSESLLSPSPVPEVQPLYVEPSPSPSWTQSFVESLTASLAAPTPIPEPAIAPNFGSTPNPQPMPAPVISHTTPPSQAPLSDNQELTNREPSIINNNFIGLGLMALTGTVAFVFNRFKHTLRSNTHRSEGSPKFKSVPVNTGSQKITETPVPNTPTSKLSAHTSSNTHPSPKGQTHTPSKPPFSPKQRAHTPTKTHLSSKGQTHTPSKPPFSPKQRAHTPPNTQLSPKGQTHTPSKPPLTSTQGTPGKFDHANRFEVLKSLDGSEEDKVSPIPESPSQKIDQYIEDHKLTPRTPQTPVDDMQVAYGLIRESRTHDLYDKSDYQNQLEELISIFDSEGDRRDLRRFADQLEKEINEDSFSISPAAAPPRKRLFVDEDDLETVAETSVKSESASPVETSSEYISEAEDDEDGVVTKQNITDAVQLLVKDINTNCLSLLSSLVKECIEDFIDDYENIIERDVSARLENNSAITPFAYIQKILDCIDLIKVLDDQKSEIEHPILLKNLNLLCLEIFDPSIFIDFDAAESVSTEDAFNSSDEEDTHQESSINLTLGDSFLSKLSSPEGSDTPQRYKTPTKVQNPSGSVHHSPFTSPVKGKTKDENGKEIEEDSLVKVLLLSDELDHKENNPETREIIFKELVSTASNLEVIDHCPEQRSETIRFVSLVRRLAQKLLIQISNDNLKKEHELSENKAKEPSLIVRPPSVIPPPPLPPPPLLLPPPPPSMSGIKGNSLTRTTSAALTLEEKQEIHRQEEISRLKRERLRRTEGYSGFYSLSHFALQQIQKLESDLVFAEDLIKQTKEDNKDKDVNLKTLTNYADKIKTDKQKANADGLTIVHWDNYGVKFMKYPGIELKALCHVCRETFEIKGVKVDDFKLSSDDSFEEVLIEYEKHAADWSELIRRDASRIYAAIKTRLDNRLKGIEQEPDVSIHEYDPNKKRGSRKEDNITAQSKSLIDCLKERSQKDLRKVEQIPRTPIVETSVQKYFTSPFKRRLDQQRTIVETGKGADQTPLTAKSKLKGKPLTLVQLKELIERFEGQYIFNEMEGYARSANMIETELQSQSDYDTLKHINKREIDGHKLTKEQISQREMIQEQIDRKKHYENKHKLFDQIIHGEVPKDNVEFQNILLELDKDMKSFVNREIHEYCLKKNIEMESNAASELKKFMKKTQDLRMNVSSSEVENPIYRTHQFALPSSNSGGQVLWTTQ